MRARADELFRVSEALRKRVEELETHVAVLESALLKSNDENVALAHRVRELEGSVYGDGIEIRDEWRK